MNKVDSNIVAELERYFTPNGYVVNKLPDKKSVRDHTEVYIKQTDGTYKTYRMVEGNWIQTNSGLTTIEEIVKDTTSLSKGGSSVSLNSAVAENAADITAIQNILPSYVETDVDYTLPTAVNIENKIIAVKNTHISNTLTIDCYGAETIDGETSQDIGPDECLTVMSNNTNWIII